MDWRSFAAGVALATLSGCFIFDGDGDGLTSSQEKEFGSDPKNADSDADGIEDGEEVDLDLDPVNADVDGDRLLDGAEITTGTDPRIADTDGDGYFDGDEVTEGHDPLDEKDRIYKGRWPYYWDKDNVKGGSGDLAEVGKRFRRLKMLDQNGEEVDLFDFYGSGKPVVVDVSGQWCFWCQVLANYLTTGVDTQGIYEAAWPRATEAIANGEVYWVTVMDSDYSGQAGTASPEVCQEWDDVYPSKKIPCLSDMDQSTIAYLNTYFWPTTVLLDDQLKLQDTGSFGDAGGVLEALAAQLD